MDYGFSSGYFLNNLGTQLFIFLALIILHTVVRCARKLKWIKARYFLENSQLWTRNVLIVAAVESYVLILLCGLINLHDIHFGSFGETVQSLTAIGAFASAIGLTLPFILLYFNWDALVVKAYINKPFEIFVRELSIEKGRTIIIWPLYFLVRRLILALTVVLLNELLVVQFQIVVFNIILAFILLSSASPFADPFQTRLALCNEFFTLVLLYHFMCFT